MFEVGRACRQNEDSGNTFNILTVKPQLERPM